MKKFSFSLDTVLDYRTQTLDSLKIEHGAILAQVRQQEEVLEQIEAHYDRTNAEFSQKKLEGLTIAGALTYELALRALEQDIKRETEKLHRLRLLEEKKREQVVSAKIDTTSLEKLREKKFESYNKDVAKKEEQFIDEFVSTSRIIGGSTSTF